MKKILAAAIFFIVLQSGVSPAAQIEDISDRKYLPKILELIKNSQGSIDASLYQILLADDPAHPISQILTALAEAHSRGVRVRILLNRYLDYSAGDSVPLARSMAAVEFLRARGIEVVMAHSSRRLHDKLIVIDNRYVIEGSMNWTKTALTSNWESATLIDSADLALAKLARIRAIPVSEEKTLDSLGDEGEMIEIPSALITDEKYFPDMVEDKDERIFEFYLWLVKESSLRGRLTDGPDAAISEPGLLRFARNDEQWFSVTDPTLFRVFRLNPSKSQKDNRREAVRLLKKLEKQGLIELNIPSAGADVEITLIVLGRHCEDGRSPDEAISGLPRLLSEARNDGNCSQFKIPSTYFTYSYPVRLSLAAEFFYLLARLEMSQSPSAPWWWRSQEYLTQTYHLHHTTLAAGALELQRENLIEVVHDDAPLGRPHSERLVNRYRVNRLTDLAAREAQFGALIKKFGQEKFKLARTYADKIDEPNDPLVIAAILKWMENYPAEYLASAFQQVSRYERNNPRRSLYYLRGILEGMKK